MRTLSPPHGESSSRKQVIPQVFLGIWKGTCCRHGFQQRKWAWYFVRFQRVQLSHSAKEHLRHSQNHAPGVSNRDSRKSKVSKRNPGPCSPSGSTFPHSAML
mmetsp:Transcript_44701/g.92448  ORF Transcript_44701/g.92448 Transcript_44701/m.92448 type:complete len:102 (+) Transcript_44701:413-718(+)